MSGIAMVMDIAKGALSAQSFGLDVTAHNIANVNTDGYSRQRAVFETNDPYLYGGVILGRGTSVSDVLRISDQFIENQVADQKGDLSSSQETESYMRVLEGLFNESSDSSISSMLSGFWNLWHDVTNNPSGDSERIALYEHSVLMADQFNLLKSDLTQLQTDLTSALSSAVEEINQITSEIGDLNNQIVGMETGSIANDLRDKRNYLFSQLSEYLDVKSFEQTDGSLTVITAMGCVLVNGKDNYELNLNGTALEWESSSGSKVDITDYMSTGKVGGWLDMRDEIIAKYKLDLDALAKAFIWSVNQQHSQGVGLSGFSTVTGSYAASDATEELGTSDSGLNYYDEISDGTFNVWVYDSTGAVVGGAPNVITVDADPGGTTLTSLAAAINGISNITASVTSANKLQVVAASGYTFAFSDDSSNVLAALGVNTFFTGSGAGDMNVSTTIGSNKDFIAAAHVDNDATSSGYGTFSTGDNTNARAIADL
ncbi:MAG: flagellar hook-associated protein FlgK, partial [Deltaproteobacteria bacterium]|nr:flagellar hook-associated protein FlgK [Deltaproteobacteria bacterium]